MPVAGKDGLVKTTNGEVGYLDSWSLSFTGDTAETSSFGQRAKEFVNTTISASGSASGTLDTQDAEQKTIMDMFAAGGTLSEVTLHLVVKPGGSSDEEYTGQAVLTGIEIGSSYSDKVTFSFNFQFTGEVTHNEYSA